MTTKNFFLLSYLLLISVFPFLHSRTRPLDKFYNICYINNNVLIHILLPSFCNALLLYIYHSMKSVLQRVKYKETCDKNVVTVYNVRQQKERSTRMFVCDTRVCRRYTTSLFIIVKIQCEQFAARNKISTQWHQQFPLIKSHISHTRRRHSICVCTFIFAQLCR